MSVELHTRKNELAAAYSNLGNALTQVSQAAHAFGLALGHLGPGEMEQLDHNALIGLATPQLGNLAAANEEAAPVEKKKRKKREKKPKDPNMPKRPPSAYLLFQNDVRQQYRDSEPADTPYADVLRKISHSWQAMTDEERKPWVEAAENNVRQYEQARDTYYTANPDRAPKKWGDEHRAADIPVNGPDAMSKEAEKVAQAAVASASASGVKKEKKEKKDKKHKKAPTPPPASSTSEDSSDSDDSSDDDSDTSSSEAPAAKIVASPSKKSSDKHKSKKSKN